MSLSTDLLRAEYWTRLPQGRRPGFIYRRPDGRQVKRAADLERVAKLAIPPAWTDVYVSPEPDAELQAFGRDQAGRLQYRYHHEFMQQSALQKWRRLGRFADVLPRLRAITRSDLLLKGWPKDKVMALMTRLLHLAFFRVGSLRYTQKHRTHGLCTLQKRHLHIDGNRLEFAYRGKHGIDQVQQVRDVTLAKHLKGLRELSGPWLFQYVDDAGQAHRIRSRELNAYLWDRIGPFTAKDFRTWGGTLCAAEYLAEVAKVGEVPPRQAVIDMVKAVAQQLGNTPSVARGSYICPIIIDEFLEGKVIDEVGNTPAPRVRDRGLTRSEASLRRLLQPSLEPKTRRASAKATALPKTVLPRRSAVRAPASAAKVRPAATAPA
ncbi:MAG: DNA topoisomerase IB [Pseudomonadota bacterium]